MSARLAVLVSGSGSNLQALIDARDRGELAAQIVLVVSNQPGVRALERARIAGIATEILDHRTFASREAFDEALHQLLLAAGADFVALAGFMRLLTPTFVSRWQGKLVNIHPSLLPAFPGAHAIRDALAAGAAQTGVTVHFVDEGTDTGPIIAQAVVPVVAGDTEATLAKRLHVIEHRIFPQAVAHLCAGRLRLVGRSVLGKATWTGVQIIENSAAHGAS